MKHKRKRPKWQKLGFRNFAHYIFHQKHQQDQKVAISLLSSLESRDERHHREATDREKYHETRLQELKLSDVA